MGFLTSCRLFEVSAWWICWCVGPVQLHALRMALQEQAFRRGLSANPQCKPCLSCCERVMWPWMLVCHGHKGPVAFAGMAGRSGAAAKGQPCSCLLDQEGGRQDAHRSVLLQGWRPKAHPVCHSGDRPDNLSQHLVPPTCRSVLCGHPGGAAAGHEDGSQSGFCRSCWVL